MIKENKGVNNRLLNIVIVNYISNDKISRLRGLKKAPNSPKVKCET